MKKKLLLLLLYLTGISMVGQNPTRFPYGVQIKGGQTATSTTSKIISQETDGTLNTIDAINLPVSTATQAKIDILNHNANSGILSGGIITVNADPTKWDLAFGTGYVVNSLTGEVSPVSWGTQAALTTPYRTTSVATYVLIANAGGGIGTVEMQNTPPTQQQLRTHIYLGKLAHTTFGNILFAVPEPSRMFDTAGQISDLNRFLGSGNVDGNVITYNGANMNINCSAGMTYRPGANYANDRNSPSITTEPSFTAGTFRNKFRNGSGGWTAVNTTTVDNNHWDDGSGILQVVPNNKWTIMVFWRFGGTGTIHCDYGQAVYDNKVDALLAAGKIAVAEDPENKRDASRRAWLVVKQGVTVLNDINTAEFINADKLGERSAGNSSTGTLQTAYNNSVTPQITTTTGGGAVAIKRGSAADTDNVLVVQNGSGSNTFSVTGNGNITGGTYNGYVPETPAIKSNESLAGAKRKGDVLYGIIDQYTGEEMTLSKVTGTPTVDGIIYFQLGSEYFKRNFKELNVLWFGATGNGVTNDSPAFDNAVSAVSADGNIVNIPSGYNFVLNSSIATGSKKVIWKIGASKITCPQGHEAFVLQSNGSQLLGSGRNSTVFVMRAPTTPVSLPTISLSVSSGNVSLSSYGTSSGVITTPLVMLSESPATSQYTNDAAIIATAASGSVSNLVVASEGEGYVTPPSVSYLGGGASAIKIEGVQACTISDLSIDFSNIPNSVGIFHNGGWWADIKNISAVYNTSTGVSSENETTLGLVVNSYTLGSPGSTGSYGGTYVSNYSNLIFSKRYIVGHDTSTATTLQFNTCDFKNSYIHAAVGVIEINPVAQGDTGSLYDLVNVDGLTLVGGDFEGAARWFHLVGSCNNIKALNTIAYSATGERFRGMLGVGNLFDFAKTNSTEWTLKSGSLTSGIDYINSGFKSKHRQGISFDGNTFVIGASNIKPISITQGKLDDKTQSSAYMYSNTSGQIGGRLAYSNTIDTYANTVDMFEFNNAGLDLKLGAFKINGNSIINPDASITTSGVSSSGNISSTGSIIASGAGGFKSADFIPNSRNPIWRFGTYDDFGISYFQGTSGDGDDTIGFHFGTATSAGSPFKVKITGKVTATSYVISGGTNSQFLKADGSVDSNTYAQTVSPTFTGTPTAPTATAGTNTAQIATTAFTQQELSSRISGTPEYIAKFDTGNSLEASSFSLNGGVITYHTTYTVSTLPTPIGIAFAVVTDATSPTYLGALTGGGSVVCPVFYNGSAWVSH